MTSDIKVPEFNIFAQLCYNEAKDRGFHETGPILPPYHDKRIVDFTANLHEEISEFHSAYRKKKLDQPCDKAEQMAAHNLPVLNCAEEELADVIIRAMDTAMTLGIDIERAVRSKMLFNRTRSFRHGGRLS